MHSSVREINVDATIYYFADRMLSFSHCGALYLWWFIWFIADLDVRFLYSSHVSAGYMCRLCLTYLAFNSSTQLIKLWVDTQARSIYYYCVVKSMTWFGWLNVKNSLCSRNILTALMEDKLWLLLLAGKTETLKIVKD